MKKKGEKDTPSASDLVKTPHGGVKGVSEMMNHLDEKTRERLMGEISQANPSLAEQIESEMFNFEHLRFFSPVDLGLLIRSIPQNQLFIALRGSSDELMEVVLKSVPKRLSDAIKEGIAEIGPQFKKTVDETRQNVLKLARNLESEGKLVIKTSQDENDDWV